MQNNKPLLGILVTSMPIDTPSKMFAFCQFMIAWISPDFEKRNPVLSTMTSTLLNLRIIQTCCRYCYGCVASLIIAMHSVTRMMLTLNTIVFYLGRVTHCMYCCISALLQQHSCFYKQSCRHSSAYISHC